jgi:hypothetical protein
LLPGRHAREPAEGSRLPIGEELDPHARYPTTAQAGRAGLTVQSCAVATQTPSRAPLAVTVVLGVPVFVVSGWMVLGSLRTLRAVAAMRPLRPRGSYFLYGLCASPDAPGAGRRLMRAVCDEADEHGWVLCLEALGTMAGYYADFEFRPLAPAQAMPWGETMTAMMRPPRIRAPRGYRLVNSS